MNSAVDVLPEIIRVISNIESLDDIEQDHIDFVLHWIKTTSDIFRTEKPATPDPHLVSYFVVVSPDTSQILLVDHKKARLWLPTGGHVEPGEDPKDSVKREAKEELGIEAEFLVEDPIFLTVTKTTGDIAQHTDVSLWYLLKGNPDYIFNFDPDEFNQIHWFGIDEIPFEKSDPHMKRFIQKMQNYLIV